MSPAAPARTRAAILFDRDGVLNVDEGYVFDPARLAWIDGAREAVKAVNAAGALAIVVTNQSGIGRGYYTEAQMQAFHAAMQASLAEVGARIDAFYHCPFHEDAAEARYRHPDHPDRKPNPGMLLRALADHGVEPARVAMIGDKPSDMEAAARAGIRGVRFEGGRLDALVRRLLPEVVAGPILVFGRTGQVARAIAEAEAGNGSAVMLAGRDECDLLVESPRALIERLGPAAVINAAAYTAVDRAESEPEAAFRLNAEAPRLMAEACAERCIPFVHISTDYVFDGLKPEPYVETDPIAPLSVYGRSKAAGEAGVAAAGGAWTVFRTAWVMSPGGSNFVATMRRLAETQDAVRVVSDQYGRPTLAADIAAACLDAARRGVRGDRSLRGLFHLAGADDVAWADIAERVFEDAERRTGRRPRLERITTADYPTPARRPPNSRLDTGRLRATGWSPRPWRETVDLCLSGPRS